MLRRDRHGNEPQPHILQRLRPRRTERVQARHGDNGARGLMAARVREQQASVTTMGCCFVEVTSALLSEVKKRWTSISSPASADLDLELGVAGFRPWRRGAVSQ